jgi:diadenylate cyclase
MVAATAIATVLAAAPGLLTRISGALHALNTRDLLSTLADILIVFYVVYRVLKLVRGTRAAQTMVGMALLGGLFFLAKKLDLFAVSWLFEKLIDYFIIFFVVIFQQDLRRALVQVGQNLFMRRQYEETYVIEEVVQAAGELAKQRIGALIVIERDADLGEHLGEVGVELDARVTKELLVTLFVPEPQNHMHDGAVIIRNLRVQQAGAVLPLSANAKLDKQFGTRHRAAIGITEETDAVVVVVSEERGAVSLCFNGNIARDLDAATLRKALLGLFQKKKNKGKGQQPAPRPRRPGDPPAEPAPGESKPTATKSAKRDKDSAHPAEFGPRSSEKMPPELAPLFVTQQMLRPVDPLDPPPGSAVVQTVLPASDITAPILSVQEVKKAADQAAAERSTDRGEAVPRPTSLETPKAEATARSVQSAPKGAETR